MSVFADLTEDEAYLWAILQDPSGIDVAEFTWYDQDAEYDCWRAWPFQWSWWHAPDRLQIDSAGRAVGKALSLKTPIPTPDGWTTMGTIQSGDFVFNGEGEPVEVLEAFDVQEDRPCYRVIFDDGSEITADEDHLWRTWTHHERHQFTRKDRIGKGDPEKKRPHVRTTIEILNTLKTNTKSMELNHRIDVAKPLQLTEQILPIPPYLLGYWLGDGHSAGGRITIGEEDREESCKLLERSGADINPTAEPKNFGMSYNGEFLGYQLTRLGVTNNKHIPDVYMRGSYEQRLEVLQGLMDSDGHCRADGRCENTQKIELLARQIFELLCTLGQKPFFEIKIAYCNGKDCGPVYRVGFHPVNLQPFQLSRKAILIKDPVWKTRVMQRRIREVIPTESVPVRCIQVDSPDHLFLAGETFVPTHNSTGISVRSFSFVFRYPGKELVLTAPEALHLDLITQKIEQRIMSVNLTREMITKGRQIRHRPFEVDFQNGSRILGRIPHRDGSAVKGCASENSLILTKEGLVEARFVQVRDEVWTHKSRWMPVLEVQHFEDEMFEVLGRGLSGILSLKVSDRHRFFGRYGDQEPCWSGLEDLDSFNWAVVDDRKQLIYLPVYNVEPTGRGNLVNIITEDHSYIADGIVCHNTHGIVLELDEAQNYPNEGWEELIETLNRNEKEGVQAHWMVHGVTRGIKDYFNKFTLPDSGWKVHKIPSMIRPGWTDEERQEKIAMYGSRNAPSYRRNLLGDPGDEEASIFVTTRLLRCVDMNEDSEYNQNLYHFQKVTSEGLLEDNITIERGLELPAHHRDLAKEFTMWAGADLGMTNHPTELLVFMEVPMKNAKSLFQLISRLHLERIRAQDQVSAILHLIDYYNLKAIGLDKTGLGLPIYQDLQDRSPEYLDRIKGYNFSSKILVDFDKSIEVDDIRGDRIKDAGIEKNVLEESTDCLRTLVDGHRLRLPSDLDLIKEFQGQTFKEIKTGMDQYGRTRRFSTGTFHALDASRMAALAHSQHAIEELTKPQPNEDVCDVFFFG